MKLKEFILNSLNIDFKTLELGEPNQAFLDLVKKTKIKTDDLFYQFLKKEKPQKRANLVFLIRALDFQLWRFPKNWEFFKGPNFFSLLKRTQKLFSFDFQKINFSIFKRIISPKEDLKLARKRFFVFKEVLSFLKKYDFDFNKFFEENKKPFNFSLGLTQLKSFQDFYRNFYFLKPNQLLYYEYLLAFDKTKEFKKELEELTIFSDDYLARLFIHFNLIKPKPKYFQLIKNRQLIKSKSRFEIEFRAASVILGEKISRHLHLPSYLVDNILWELSQKLASKNKLKYPGPKVETIFY